MVLAALGLHWCILVVLMGLAVRGVTPAPALPSPHRGAAVL
jgi:hypothetical protein